MNGSKFFALVQNGASELKANKNIINDLNVFPIPDGDTGDNMFMTISAGCGQAMEVACGDESIGLVADALSKGMLLGARGNSGVILSRIFAGIARGFQGKIEVSVSEFSEAMNHGVKEAYASVAKPVEGTMLTVIRDSVEFAKKESSENTIFEEYFEYLEYLVN